MTDFNWAGRLIDWYLNNKREMPWRTDEKPYYTWISEMMLQQTQVDTVIPYFNRFIARFPTVYDLAEATSDDVLKYWEGLGYYSRARNLHKAAKLIVDTYQGELPVEYEELQKLPGIGPYCAAAITSIAFHQPVPVVDGNVLRVFTRFWGIEDDIRQPRVRDDLFNRLLAPIQDVDPSAFNQGIMECGALLCKPKSPQCSKCPLSEDCVAYSNKTTDLIPFKSKLKPVPHYHIGVGIIWDGPKFLIAKRQDNGMLGGLWELPGGKQKESEHIRDTVKREIKEETGLDVLVMDELCQVKHAYSHFKITLHAYQCKYLSGTAKAISSQQIKWVTQKELENYAFPKANNKVWEKLRTGISYPTIA